MSAHRSLTCPRCTGSMEAGYIVDEGYGTRTVAKWIEGEPQRSIWTGLKLRGKEEARRHHLPLRTLRLSGKLRLALAALKLTLRHRDNRKLLLQMCSNGARLCDL